MSVNKFMHPRNIYKTPPNFKQMAIDYPEFRKYVKQEITGKIRIDFKDNETLRSLTKTLLKNDFGLDVEIPLTRLIPTIPLRLNYILWIEDLLSVCDIEPETIIHGIDIGTGASCVYPLLASKKNNWRMTATEIDTESLHTAQENVNRNNLQHLINIVKSTEDSLLKNIIDSSIIYDFCMCNPPFFSSLQELNPQHQSRTNQRPLPRNALTGNKTEVTTKGGEIEFIKNLIKESVDLKNQIKIFTTMVGHKSSLSSLKIVLRAVEVVSFKQTEFHQGHTTRWGLAWTFQNIDLRKLPPNASLPGKKKIKPIKYILPTLETENMQIIAEKIRNLFQTLQMSYEEMKSNKYLYAILVTGKTNTWSNQRRKRRENLRKALPNNQNPDQNGPGAQMELDDKINSPNYSRPETQLELDTKINSKDCNENSSTKMELDFKGEASQEKSVDFNDSLTKMDLDSSSESLKQCSKKRNRNEESEDSDDNDEEDGYYNSKKVKTNQEKIFIAMTVTLRKFDTDYQIEMSYSDGTASRDSVHQIMQYFKNNFK